MNRHLCSQFLTGSVEGPVDYQFSHQAYLNDEVRS